MARRSRSITGLLAIGLAFGVVATADTSPAAADLRPFGSCERLRSHLIDHERALPTDRRGGRAIALADADGAGAGASAAAPAPAPAGSSPTNVQEEGVDEPDLVKTDGSTIFAVDGDRLRAVDASASTPALLGSLRLPGGTGDSSGLDRVPAPLSGEETRLLLAGHRLLAISRSDANRERTLLAEIDVADPAAMRVTDTALVEGSYVSARLTGSTARVVTSDHPSVPLAERGHGRALVPAVTLRDRLTGERTRRRLIHCDDVRRPARFAGAEMLSVLTIDMRQGLPAVDVDSVMTSGQIVYASATSLYVATERWLASNASARRVSGANTAIHRFDIADPLATEYAGSGDVPGFMLDQWSLSEHEGLLRVASTTAPPWEGDRPQESESLVTVLATAGDRLTAVGSVGGLGRGEDIHAVRFMDDVGYVVTFRQVDPLYTLDLSDPTRPRVVGELKIPGYSAYLHPIGSGVLLGVGQDARVDGRTLGVQVSLFDVSDPAWPVRVDRESFGRGSSSEVEFDHHAFGYFAEHALAVVPLSGRAPEADFVGAAGLRIHPAGPDPLGRVARVSHGSSYRAQIRRSLIVGDRVFSVSAKGLAAHDPATLAVQAFVPFSG